MKRTISILAAVLFCCNILAADRLGLKTVVIDAGHGGSDPGAVSRDKKTYEKTITLDIAGKLADKIRSAYPDVNVIQTRSSDTYVTLDGRAVAANKADADLFISIHVNSATNASANGFSVHILGQSSNKNKDLYAYNMDVCRRENSVIMLEEDYTTKYEGFDPNDPESYIFMLLMQNSNLESSVRFAQTVQKNLKGGPIKADRGLWQDPFYVLWKTSMPAVLLELGFISNQQDLDALRNEDNRDKLADSILRAFKDYKTFYDGSVSATSPAQQVQPAPSKDGQAPSQDKSLFPKNTQQQAASQAVPKAVEEKKPEPAAAPEAGAVRYGVQIFATTSKTSVSKSMLMGYEPAIVGNGSLFKYVIAVSADEGESRKALPAIRKKYPDAFLVKIVNNDSVRLK